MTDIRHIGGKLTDNDIHPDSLYWDTDDEDPNEIFCSLCGLGYDTWLEVKKHIFCEHYDIVRDTDLSSDGKNNFMEGAY